MPCGLFQRGRKTGRAPWSLQVYIMWCPATTWPARIAWDYIRVDGQIQRQNLVDRQMLDPCDCFALFTSEPNVFTERCVQRNQQTAAFPSDWIISSSLLLDHLRSRQQWWYSNLTFDTCHMTPCQIVWLIMLFFLHRERRNCFLLGNDMQGEIWGHTYR